jgi:hypothetical protein
MNTERELLSLGNEFRAALMVANSPEVVVPSRTTIAPDGGVVREAARAYCTRDREQAKTETSECVKFTIVEDPRSSVDKSVRCLFT